MGELISNRSLLREMKRAYQFYIRGDYNAFDIAMARICEEWMQNVKVLDGVMMRRFIRKMT